LPRFPPWDREAALGQVPSGAVGGGRKPGQALWFRGRAGRALPAHRRTHGHGALRTAAAARTRDRRAARARSDLALGSDPGSRASRFGAQRGEAERRASEPGRSRPRDPQGLPLRRAARRIRAPRARCALDPAPRSGAAQRTRLRRCGRALARPRPARARRRSVPHGDCQNASHRPWDRPIMRPTHLRGAWNAISRLGAHRLSSTG
jgi:hypothetical protein